MMVIFRRLYHLSANSPIIWLAIVVVCICSGILAHFTERLRHAGFIVESRAQIVRDAALMASRLESQINSSFFLVSGLASYIEVKETIKEEDYTRICARMFPAIPGLVNITAAPNLVNSYVYPLEGNELVLGLDYESLPDQMIGIRMLMETKLPIVAGPFELVQGGEAIIGRFPVFKRGDSLGESSIWGIISTPIRTDALYREAELPLDDPSIEIAIRGRNGLGSKGDVFYGDGALFERDAVIFPVDLFNGNWELAILPRGGWPSHTSERWLIYGIYAILAVLVSGLTLQTYLYVGRIFKAQELERSAQQVKERFYTNMSHEIRTPLNAIYGLSELIRESTDEVFCKESAETICRSTNALTDLLSDVLALSEEAEASGGPNFEEFDLNCLLRDVAAPLMPEAERKWISLKLKELPAEGSQVCTSRLHLRQIVWNLSLNAVKFTNKGSVTIGFGFSGNELCFECADTGVGIDDGFKSRLFDAFTQEDESATRAYEGAGLGLAIVKRSVDILAGRIEFESKKDYGSTFRVFVPVKRINLKSS